MVNRIVTEAFALEGVKASMNFFSWAQAIGFGISGEVDGTCCWYSSANRRKNFYLSEPIVEVKYVFFHLKSYKFDWKTFDDLKNIPMGGIIEYDYGKTFTDAEKSGKIKVQRVPSDEMNFRKLLAGRIQLYPMADPNAGWVLLEDKFTPQESQLITYHPKSFLEDPNLYLLLSKEKERNKRLITVFNNGLSRLKNSGKYDQFLADNRKGRYPKK